MKKCFIVAPFLLGLVLVIHGPDAAAECTINQSSGPVGIVAEGTQGIGQSFTACQTGYVRSITVRTSGSPTGPAYLGLQAGTSIFPQTNPQSVNLAPYSLNSIVLDTPFPVTSGMVYSFGLMATTNYLGLAGDLSNPFADGVLIFVFNGTNQLRSAQDLLFGLEIVTEYPVPARPASWGSIKGLYL